MRLKRKNITNFKSVKAQLNTANIVCFYGGSNMGTLYPYQENLREKVIQGFKRNRLMSFSQFIFFKRKHEVTQKDI